MSGNHSPPSAALAAPGRAGATLRVATYNVHGCVGLDRQRSETRIAEVIASLSADVVALQELDVRRARSAGIDQAGAIAQQLGWQHVFHAAMRVGEEQYGNAVLSRYPLEEVCTFALPGVAPWYCRETRGALLVAVETALGPVRVINTHLGLSPRERRLQVAQLTSEECIPAEARQQPLILLGDFNSPRFSQAYRLLSRHLRDVRTLRPEAGPCRTFPTRFPALTVDHLFVTTALDAVGLRVHRTPLARVASDHFPLVAELVVKR